MKINSYIILLIVLIISNEIWCQSDSADKHLVQNYQTLENEVKEIRRDQLNYKIEKDLLKETYSTNYQTINFIITIVFGFVTVLFGVLGYIGIKNVTDIKKEYESELEKISKIKGNFDAELNNLRSLKGQFEANLTQLNKNKEEIQNKFEEIETTNQLQNKKIKLLELREKVTKLINEGNHVNALDYIAIGLDISSEDAYLVHSKAICLFKLLRYKEAINNYKILISKGMITSSIYLNMLELYLLTNQKEEFDSFKKKYHNQFESEIKKPLLLYFNVFYNYLIGNLQEAKKDIKDNFNTAKFKDELANLIWSFNEVNEYLNVEPENEFKEIFILLIDFLRNKSYLPLLIEKIDN